MCRVILRRALITTVDPSPAGSTIIDLDRVFVARGERVILYNISLRIQRGEHLAILGPNGCGKSTLLKTLTCELYPLAVNPDGSRPQSLIFGQQRWDVTRLRRRLGVVSAELPGPPMLTTTGFDAVLTGFFSSATIWPHLEITSAMRERVDDLLVQVGATALHDRFVGEMSAGQQRRIMIARALAGSGQGNEAQMLLLDEPSNALDLRAQQDLRELMRDLAQRGVSLLLITHHTADIVPEIGRVLMMQGGRVLADGRRSSLLTAERLSTLFRTEVQVAERDGYLFSW